VPQDLRCGPTGTLVINNRLLLVVDPATIIGIAEVTD
jgi:hypothetical protein